MHPERASGSGCIQYGTGEGKGGRSSLSISSALAQTSINSCSQAYSLFFSPSVVVCMWKQGKCMLW